MSLARTLSPVVASLLVVSGCGAPTDAGPYRVISSIDSPSALGSPDSVASASPFAVTVFTTRGACSSSDGASAETVGFVADVTVYDLDPPRGTICILREDGVERSVQLMFTTPGTGVIRLHVRTMEGKIVVVERAVTVLP